MWVHQAFAGPEQKPPWTAAPQEKSGLWQHPGKNQCKHRSIPGRDLPSDKESTRNKRNCVFLLQTQRDSGQLQKAVTVPLVSDVTWALSLCWELISAESHLQTHAAQTATKHAPASKPFTSDSKQRPRQASQESQEQRASSWSRHLHLIRWITPCTLLPRPPDHKEDPGWAAHTQLTLSPEDSIYLSFEPPSHRPNKLLLSRVPTAGLKITGMILPKKMQEVFFQMSKHSLAEQVIVNKNIFIENFHYNSISKTAKMFKLTTKYHLSNLYKDYLSLYMSQIWPEKFFLYIM